MIPMILLTSEMEFGGTNDDSILNLFGLDLSRSTFEKMMKYAENISKFNKDIDTPFVTIIYNLITPAALGLVIAIVVFHILKILMDKGFDKVTPTSLLLPIIKAALAFIVIHNGAMLIGSIMGLSNRLTSPEMIKTFIDAAETENSLVKLEGDIVTIGNALEGEGITAQITKAMFTAGGFFVELGYQLSGFIGLIGSGLAEVFLIKEFVVTKASMLIRFAFSPIAVADMTEGGHRGGPTYIKQLIGCGFALFAMTASIYVIKVINSSIMLAGVDVEHPSTLVSNYLIISLVGPFAAVAAARRAKQVIQSALS